MKKASPDVGVSVRTRLRRIAAERGEDFQLVLLRYATERLLFRLASSSYATQFVLKGAALFTVWTGQPHRTTRDVDLLGFGDSDLVHIRTVFSEVIALEVAEDGVRFDDASLQVQPIREVQDYGGVRVEVVALITTARVRLQIDIGFGDAVTPEASLVSFPPLLDFPPPRLRAYPKETVIAEKLEAMVKLGVANSRMKDFYDIAVLAREFDFDGEVLTRAIRATFARRQTPLPAALPVALTRVFADDPMKKTQWSGFVRKAGVTDASSLAKTIEAIAVFVEPPLAAASSRAPLAARWRRGGPWT